MLDYLTSSQSLEPRLAPPASEAIHRSTRQLARSPYRVLLVDDDEKSLQLVRDILVQYPDVTIVGEAYDGLEAVALAQAHQPDVVIMDVVMPYLDGIEATLRIKDTCPRTVVIGLAGHFATKTYNAMRTAGAAAFMCKNQVLGIHDTILFAMGQ
jgi:DNA-binding NarL/FixJ family response regulator